MATPLPSALHTRLRQWSPLTSNELSFIRDAVGNLKKDLDRSESRIRSLTEELRQLERERDGLRERLGTHQALMAPIRTLPFELLSEIFYLVCDDIDLSYSESEAYGSNYSGCRIVSNTVLSIPPLVLSQVCSTWNGLVNHGTSMWSKLSLSFALMTYQVKDDSFITGMQRIGYALACIFSRAGNAPLGVHLGCYNDRSEKELEPDLRFVLARFLGQKHRWKSTSICFTPKSPIQLCGPMPALETLKFSVGSAPRAAAPLDAQVGHIFLEAPALRTVTFCSFEAFSRTRIFWASLHTLAFEIPDHEAELSSSQLMAVLMQCKSLRTLIWSARMGQMRSDHEPVILPVTSLVAGLTADYLLPHVALPNIQNLTITVPNRNGLTSVQERFRDMITTLELSGPGDFTEPMLAQLGSFPEVQTLIVAHVGRGGLTCDLQEIPLRFPKLKFLSYKITASASYFHSILSRVVRLIKAFEQSRDGSGGFPSQKIYSVLQKVELQGFEYESLSEEQQLMLRGVTDSGLVLEVPGKGGKTRRLDECEQTVHPSVDSI